MPLTSADEDVTLEVDPVGGWEAEHPVEYRLRRPRRLVIHEGADKVPLRTPDGGADEGISSLLQCTERGNDKLESEEKFSIWYKGRACERGHDRRRRSKNPTEVLFCMKDKLLKLKF